MRKWIKFILALTILPADWMITELEILEGYNDKVRMELENKIAAFQQLHYNFAFHF